MRSRTSRSPPGPRMFTIPMRGNEETQEGWFVSGLQRFTIPMRGNEVDWYFKNPHEAEVYDPHEG